MTKVIHQQSFRTQRRQIDPTKIRKRSDMAVHQGLESQVLSGWAQDRIATSTGFRSQGHENRAFACFREIMAPGSVGPKLKHEKKTRMVLVLSGSGAVNIVNEAGKIRYSKLNPGDEFVLNPGDSYQFFTTSKTHLELQVMQESKYEANLIVLEEAQPLDIPLDLGHTTGDGEESTEVPTIAPRRGTSKASQQIWEKQAMSAMRKGQQIPEPPPSVDIAQQTIVPTATAVASQDPAARPTVGTNARPMTEAELLEEFGG